MNKKEKIEFVKEKYFDEWTKTRSEVVTEMSNNQGLFCCCGKLATGMHENSCRKFIDRVDSETTKRILKNKS